MLFFLCRLIIRNKCPIYIYITFKLMKWRDSNKEKRRRYTTICTLNKKVGNKKAEGKMARGFWKSGQKCFG